MPDTLVAEGRHGVAIGEDPVEARRSFEEAITRAASVGPWLREHPPTVEWWGGRFDPALTDLADPIVATVWGVQLKLQSATDPQLATFLAKYSDASLAPEPKGECTGGVGTPER